MGTKTAYDHCLGNRDAGLKRSVLYLTREVFTCARSAPLSAESEPWQLHKSLSTSDAPYASFHVSILELANLWIAPAATESAGEIERTSSLARDFNLSALGRPQKDLFAEASTKQCIHLQSTSCNRARKNCPCTVIRTIIIAMVAVPASRLQSRSGVHIDVEHDFLLAGISSVHQGVVQTELVGE